MFSAMAPRDRQFSVSSRCELLPCPMTLPAGLGRRENSVGTTTLNFEHDGSAMIGWTSTTAEAYYFTTMPGGGALAGSYIANGRSRSFGLFE
jgi:hypothetical protein